MHHHDDPADRPRGAARQAQRPLTGRGPLARIAGAAALLTMLLLGLAGCGPGTPASAPPATPTAAPHATATTAPTHTSSAATPTAAPAPTGTPAVKSPLAAAYSSYEVGAYYFSGWSHGPNDNLSPLLTGKYHQYEPLIGWYDDSQTQVDKTIDQAANAGIDFFAFDWYDLPLTQSPTDLSLNDGLRFYLTSKERHRLKFCLIYIDQNQFVPPPKRWPTLIEEWIKYFKQPGYVTVNGKPLFIVFSPEHMRDAFGGSAGVKRAIDQLRSRARAEGLPGVTVAVGATVAPHANPYHVQQLNSEGYDVTTGYNYHSMGNEQYNVPVPYSHLVRENEQMWDRVAARVHDPYIPVVTSGWDQRFSSREQQTAIIYAGRTPRAFTCYAVQARHWIDTHPTQTVKERMVMIYAWNEIGEGGAIIPNHAYGYAYADAVRAVFGGPSQAPSTPAYCH